MLGCRHPVEGQAARQYIVTKTGITEIRIIKYDIFFSALVVIFGHHFFSKDSLHKFV